ncbi:hypothetical protein BD779DRAFT_1561206 [Infundibulicybe gibba]|nr:hypothetical protein BD779DRAFT_1561206 [Infundibulicybe gibba]
MLIDFPLELVYKILLHVAQSSTLSCRMLCEVSTWVRHLALPLLYTTVPAQAIENMISLHPVCSPSPGFKPAEAVRNIWAPSDNTNWLDIMRHCTRLFHLASTYEGLTQLVSDGKCFSNPKDTLMETNDLRILMLDNPSWAYDGEDWSLCENSNDKNLHFFRRITHLRLEDPAFLEAEIRFSHMDRLTHLAIPFRDPEKDLRPIFEEYLKEILDALERTSVQVFVIVLSHDDLPEDKCQDVEKWVCELRNERSGVYVVRPLYDDLKEEWDAEVGGGITIWERAAEYTQLLVDRTHSRADLATSVDLPRGILRTIFLYAAKSSTSSCRALCKVAIWVRHLVLPFLYQTVAIKNTTYLNAFNRLMTSAPPACPPGPTFNPASSVRHLWVPFASDTLGSVVRYCKNVTHLAIHHRDLFRLNISSLPEHHGLPGARAHARIGDLHLLVLDNRVPQYHGLPPFDSIGTRALFSHITHLRLENPLETYSEVPISYTPVLHTPVIFTETSVKVLVLVLEYGSLLKTERQTAKGWVCELRKEDHRVYVVMQLYSKLEMEWDAEARGGATIWERAVNYTQFLMDRWSRRPEVSRDE